MGRTQARSPDPNCYKNLEGQFTLKELGCKDFINNTAINNSIIGIAGKDFAFVAVSVSNSVEKEQALHRIACRLVLASTGPQCDIGNLAALLRARLYMNEYLRQKAMKSRCVALLLSCLLTNAVTDPKHTSYMIGGLEENGRGVIYAYDLLGYHQRTQYRAMGRGKVFLQNYLNDCLRPKCMSTASNSNYDFSASKEVDIDVDDALGIIVNAFRMATLCNKIPATNKLIVSGITKYGVCLEEIPL